MRGYNTLLGSHYDHYHLDYDSYKHDDIPDDIFEVDQGDEILRYKSEFYLSSID